MRIDTELPVEPAIPALQAALAGQGAAVLQAPPGAGKTTRVPLALLDAPWLDGRTILMLEPRRLATRAAARRMAWTLGEDVGGTIGYRVRLENRVSRRTRVEVVTEGILTRMLQDDPALERVGLVIFDEFHERSLHADLGLALTLHSRSLVRPDLRVLAMSATLDAAPVAALLGDAPVISSEGRAWPVETRCVLPRSGEPMERETARLVRRALAETEGDVLVFLPGAPEIHRVRDLIGDLGPALAVHPLFGDLPPDEQDAAIRPAPPGQRKVVLATTIAETSLTIEGVRVVVDAGYARVPRFSPRTGMTRLETVRVSRASADQRRGRAGRTAPGVCYRLWAEHDDGALLPRTTPEILEADLAPLALELAIAGVDDPLELRWVDPPPATSLAQARELLRELECIDDRQRATPHGRAVAGLGVHPRLAHMVERGRARGAGALACDLAALLTERDPLRGSSSRDDADIRTRLAVVRGATVSAEVDRGALHRIRAQAEQLGRRIGIERRTRTPDEDDNPGALLALAYPDRVARGRAGQPGRFLLRNGRGAALRGAQSLASAAFIVVADLDDQRPEGVIRLAAAVSEADVRSLFAAQIEEQRIVQWDERTGAVVAERRATLGAIVLDASPLRDVAADEVAHALAGAIARNALADLDWTDAALRLQQRVAFARALDPDFPDLSRAELARTADDWLPGALHRARTLDDARRVSLAGVLSDRLSWKQRALLDELAPTHIVVPTGSHVPVDYSDAAAPFAAVRLQELFGLADTPRVGGGRVPVTLHLLSPAGRPVQVTRDLAGFWRTSYFDVRKDLRGRYPKHPWPDDPMSAEPTRRAKPRG